MRPGHRACICFLAGKLIFGREAATIYDCLEGRLLDTAGLLETDNVSLQEVRPPLGKPVPFDELGTRHAHYNSLSGDIYLNTSGNTFRGYSAADSSLFMGKASGNLVVIYDHREKSFFKYRFCFLEKSGRTCGTFCRGCGAGKTGSEEKKQQQQKPRKQ